MKRETQLAIFAIVAALGLVALIAVETITIAQEAEARDAIVVFHLMQVKDAVSVTKLSRRI